MVKENECAKGECVCEDGKKATRFRATERPPGDRVTLDQMISWTARSLEHGSR